MKTLKKKLYNLLIGIILIPIIIIALFSFTSFGGEIISDFKTKIKNDISTYYNDTVFNISNNIRSTLGIPLKQKEVLTPIANNNEQKNESIPIEITSKQDLFEIPFYYDGSNAPTNISKEQALLYIKKASATWENACGVAFVYKGDRLSDYVNPKNTINEQTGIVKWVDSMDGDTIGEAHVGDENGYASGFVLSLSQNYFKQNQNDMLPVVIHEMGHVIGLDHSENVRSIMYPSEQAGATLQESDKAMCRYYRMVWDGVNEHTAREKTGILTN